MSYLEALFYFVLFSSFLLLFFFSLRSLEALFDELLRRGVRRRETEKYILNTMHENTEKKYFLLYKMKGNAILFFSPPWNTLLSLFSLQKRFDTWSFSFCIHYLAIRWLYKLFSFRTDNSTKATVRFHGNVSDAKK